MTPLERLAHAVLLQALRDLSYHRFIHKYPVQPEGLKPWAEIAGLKTERVEAALEAARTGAVSFHGGRRHRLDC